MRRLSPGALRALANAREAVEQDSVRRAIESEQADALRHVFAAMVIAKDLPTFRALLAGESVPVDRCDAEWVERYGFQVKHDG